MRIRRGETIEGLPASAARKLMRAYRDGHGLQQVVDILDVNKTEAHAVLNAFCKAGYLQTEEVRGMVLWSATLKGNALANAALRATRRATAERQLEALINRVYAYNADPNKIHSVSRVIVFGSYLDTEQQWLGDLDIAFAAVRRFQGEEYEKRKRVFMNQAKRNFKDFFERLCWPELELHYWLKGRSPVISLTTEDITRFTDRFECVYKVENDSQAIQPPVGTKLDNFA